jgi:hypothetical protein
VQKNDVFILKYKTKKIIEMRMAGRSIKTISEILGLQKNQVSWHCESIGLVGKRVAFEMNIKELQIKMANGEACRNCGVPIEQTRKNRRFCSDRCRCVWWNDVRNNKKGNR